MLPVTQRPMTSCWLASTAEYPKRTGDHEMH